MLRRLLHAPERARQPGAGPPTHQAPILSHSLPPRLSPCSCATGRGGAGALCPLCGGAGALGAIREREPGHAALPAQGALQPPGECSSLSFLPFFLVCFFSLLSVASVAPPCLCVGRCCMRLCHAHLALPATRAHARASLPPAAAPPLTPRLPAFLPACLPRAPPRRSPSRWACATWPPACGPATTGSQRRWRLM